MDAPPIQLADAVKTTPYRRACGAAAPPEDRLATEAAGATHVIDHSPPGQSDATTHSLDSVSTSSKRIAVRELQKKPQPFGSNQILLNWRVGAVRERRTLQGRGLSSGGAMPCLQRMK